MINSKYGCHTHMRSRGFQSSKFGKFMTCCTVVLMLMLRKYSPILYKEKIESSNNKSSDIFVTYERNNISGLKQ